MCTQDMCDNHGTCVEQWNSYSCDCDMTAFVGPTCSERKLEIKYLKYNPYVRFYFELSTSDFGTFLHLYKVKNCYSIRLIFVLYCKVIQTICVFKKEEIKKNCRCSVYFLWFWPWRGSCDICVPWRTPTRYAKRPIGFGFHHFQVQRRVVPCRKWHFWRLPTAWNGNLSST